jgi:hypothetical protein
MKWLLRLLMIIAAGALAATALSFTVLQTTARSEYLQSIAARTHLADELARGLPAVAEAYAPGPGTGAAVRQVVTAGYVQNQLDQVLPALVDSLKTGAATPTLNLTGILSAIQPSGIVLPDRLQKYLNAPQPVIPAVFDAPVRGASQAASQFQIAGPVIIGIVLGLIFMLARGRRYLLLGETLLLGAVLILVAAGLIQLPPRLVSATLASSVAAPLEPAIRHYLGAIADDQSRRLIIMAGASAMIGIVFAGLHVVMHAVSRFSKAEKQEDERQPTRLPKL